MVCAAYPIRQSWLHKGDGHGQKGTGTGAPRSARANRRTAVSQRQSLVCPGWPGVAGGGPAPERRRQPRPRGVPPCQGGVTWQRPSLARRHQTALSDRGQGPGSATTPGRTPAHRSREREHQLTPVLLPARHQRQAPASVSIGRPITLLTEYPEFPRRSAPRCRRGSAGCCRARDILRLLTGPGFPAR
jgi:hypothetical protein